MCFFYGIWLSIEEKPTRIRNDGCDATHTFHFRLVCAYMFCIWISPIQLYLSRLPYLLFVNLKFDSYFSVLFTVGVNLNRWRSWICVNWNDIASEKTSIEIENLIGAFYLLRSKCCNRINIFHFQSVLTKNILLLLLSVNQPDSLMLFFYFINSDFNMIIINFVYFVDIGK